jgi:ATP-binding cassette subfamily F protein uup
MSLISINSVGKDYGIKSLFSNLTLVINPKEKVGLIGANGSGKSTLLKMIMGLEDPDTGEIILRRDTLKAYVKQQDEFPSNITAIDYLLSEVPTLKRHQAEQLLNSSGLTDFDCLTQSMSGGMKKRLAIITGLAKNPDVLLLDEPTNHLDIPGILWLEETLLNFSGAILFISHDRFFIERIAERTIELDARFPGGYISADGGYSAVIDKRDQTLEQLRATKDSLRNKVRREVEWLRAGVKARTTKAKYRSDEAHRLIAELNSMQLDKQTAELGFAATGRKTKELVKFDRVSGGITNPDGSPALELWKDLSFTVYPGTRIGIVGGNGVGKTTLLKTIVGELPVIKGKILRASNLKINYFGQMREQLNPEVTVERFLSPVVSWARRFLFNTDQLSSKIKDLSGGEQARLLLAKLSLLDSDILVFDEPTNDLDIATLEILEQSFIEFPGAILIVSHDRYLMSRVCTTILGFVKKGTIIQTADYLQFEQEWDQTSSSNNSKDLQQSTSSSTQNSFFNKKEIQSLERKIATIENKIAQATLQLHDPNISSDGEKLIAIQSEIDSLQSNLDSLMEKWLELSAV